MDKRRLVHDFRPSRRFSVLNGLTCAALALLFSGCQTDEITTNRVANPPNNVRLLAAMVTEPDLDRVWFFKLEGPLDKVDAHAKEFDQFLTSVHFTRVSDEGLRWELPAGWVERKGNGLRKRTLVIGDKSDNLAVTIVALGRMAGDVPMNVNRWRKQVGLPSLPLSEADDDTASVTIDGMAGYRVDLKGPGNPLAKSPSSMPLGGDGGAATCEYKVPEGWRKSPTNVPLAMATFIPRNQDNCIVSISPMKPADTQRLGYYLDNVNRWRSQVSKEPYKDEGEMEKDARHEKVGNADCLYFDFTGKQPEGRGKNPGAPHRLLAVALKRGDMWWFFKISGPPDEVGKEETAFKDFLHSVHFEGDREAKP